MLRMLSLNRSLLRMASRFSEGKKILLFALLIGGFLFSGLDCMGSALNSKINGHHWFRVHINFNVHYSSSGFEGGTPILCWLP
jgi:hypothetical protein